MFRLNVLYPASPNARFDFDYYVKNHMPLVMSLIGASAVRFEAAKGVGGAGGAPAPYVAVGQVYLTSLEGLQSAFVNHMPAIMADIAKYTDIAPVVNVEAMLT
jgi:uncharacterized protein (TIGR02118 family)